MPVAEALAGRGVKRFAVALAEEAVQLRDAGIVGRILVLGYPTVDDAEEIVGRGFEIVASSLRQIECFGSVARKMGKYVVVHLKFDTGMGRVGFTPGEALEVAEAVSRFGNVRVEGVMTHLASAEEDSDIAFTREQVADFCALKAGLEAAGFRIPLWHAANSAGIMYYPESHFSAVRPGIVLYGCYPSSEMSRPLELRQALTFKTRILRIREMPTGATISYGRTYRTVRPSRIALLPVGYADGFSRRLSNCGQVLVRGRRAPVVGRVCMDMTLVDVTEIPGVCEGDEVVIYGSQDGETISVEDVSITLDTSPHTLLTAIGKRVPRTYCHRATSVMTQK